MAALVLIFPISYTLAAPCDIKNSPPPFIAHDLTASQNTSVSYCELCGFGYVTIVITNPYQGVDMTGMQIVENLAASGLVYATAALAPTAIQARYSINGGPTVSALPAISGGGTLLTWNLGALLLPSVIGNNAFSTLKMTFPVISATSTTTPESLIAANRRIQATLTYTTSPTVCTGTITSPISTPLDTIPLREPIPAMTKQGRNVDAAQGSGSYTNTVYGNINDDVIWRIRVANTGMAALQDMRLSDLMQTGGMNIYYACSSETTATTAANNLNVLNLILTPAGAPPGPPAGCVSAGNTVNNFVVNNPFGTPNNDSPDLVDIPANGQTDIFLVGKIKNSCAASTTNTVSNLQWGCTLQPPAGGITTTSTGVTPANSTATLSDLVGLPPAGLTVQRQLRGTNLAQPVGSKGTMTITITNNTGGTIKNIKLRDVLPLEYVVDSTFTPTLIPSGGYGNYPGRTNTITWTNPAPGTVPLTSTNPADPLSNTQPQFTLTSSTVHPNYSDQRNMLRRGETLTINFRVVLIKSSYYDRVANLDVHTESPSDGTDPSNQTTTLSNSLYLTYEDYCFPGVVRNAPTYPYVDTFTAFPEDLDIDINGNIFILTNDPLQLVTLPVVVTNHGGHDARDYHVFVTFGGTIQVINVPSGCTPISISGTPPQPAPWKVWTLPAAIPDPIKYPTVYHCVPGGALPNPFQAPPPYGAGSPVTLNFDVVKVRSTDSNYAARIAADDLSFRADVVGEITLSNGTPLWFPTPIARIDGQTDRANNYSLDGIRSRAVGFNLTKSQPVGVYCSENNPPPIPSPLPQAPVPYDNLVQIGEECPYHIEAGGWFGFLTPGYTYIAVQNVQLLDHPPSGQAYISSTAPVVSSQIAGINTGTGNPFTHGPFTPLYQDIFGWDFNISSRITQLDEWFKVDTTSRILNCNSPLVGSCATPTTSPNTQSALSTNSLTSTFDAVFKNASTGLEEIFNLDLNTVGYPQYKYRSVTQTVTEPNLTLVKTVCNETLSLTGTGAACTPFTTAANGDNSNKYVFKITVCNGTYNAGVCNGVSGGVTRAPAYNVVVTDTLDATGLSYVEPFTTDLLDNDGNGIVDDALANSEGLVTNNNLNNFPLANSPAVINFSYTDNPSSKLWQINPGQTVTLLYRVAPSIHTSAGQTLGNSVVATYDSLKYYFNTTHVYGAQTGPLGGAGNFDGARIYNSTPATASIVIATPITQPKQIVALSNHSGSIFSSGQGVSVGEEIQYQLHTSLPIVTANGLTISDTLPAGIVCTEAPSITLNAGSYTGVTSNLGGIITPTCSGNLVSWNFGNLTLSNSLTAPYDLVVNFIGRVQNIAANVNDVTLSNGGSSTNATMSYTDTSGATVTQKFVNADVKIQEPKIVLTKTFSQTTADAADQVTVTVTATNNTPGYLATAYNLQVMDDLSASPSLSYIGGSVSSGVTVNTASNKTTFSWPAGDAIPFGGTRTFSYKVLVNSGAQPLEILSNASNNPMYAKWDSLPGQTTCLNTNGVAPYVIGTDGAPDGLRNGALTNTVITPNNYQITASALLSVPAVTMNKTDLSPSVVPAIGAYKQFEIDIALPEGKTNNLQISDNLAAAGLSYLLSNNGTYSISYTSQGLSTVNGVAVNPGTGAFTPASEPADNTTSAPDALWSIGPVVTLSEDDSVINTSPINPQIKIIYSARVDNNTNIIAGVSLQNSALAKYTSGAVGNPTASTASSSTSPITVVEPRLTLNKTVTNFSVPGALPLGLNILEYTITLNNTGTSTAYDINIADILPPQLSYDASFTPAATINGVSVAGFVSTPAGAPAGPLVWGRSNSDGSLDLPVGQTLVIKYHAALIPNPVAGTVLNNSVYADWTSLNNLSVFERTGTGCPAITQPNNYCVGPALAAITVSAPNPLSKLNTQATAAIGQQFKYRITVPAVAIGTAMYDVNILDNLGLSVADMSYVAITPVSGPVWTPQVSGAPKNLVISGSGSGLDIPAGQRAVFDITVVLNDSAQNVSGLLFHNTSSYTFNATKGNNGTQSAGGSGITADMTIVGPDTVTLQKSGPATMRVGMPDIFTLNIQNTGIGKAWDMTVVDKLPPSPGMCATAPNLITAQMFLADGTTSVAVLVSGTDYTAIFSGAPACTLTFTMKTTAAAIDPGNFLRLTYQASLDSNVVAGNTLTNIAAATQWYSAVTPANAGTGHTYTGPLTDGTSGTLDNQDAHSLTTQAPLLNFRKTVANITTGGSGATAKPGDVLQYTITLNNLSTSTLSNFSMTDELDRLNATAMFTPGSLSLITIPIGASATFTSSAGGSKGSGLVDIRNLSLGPQGGGSDAITVVFQATLASVITSGTTVFNQAQLPTFAVTPLNSDDLLNGTNTPLIIGDEVATKTVITSAPVMQVKKISQDITGDPLVLLAGDHLRYTITVKNIGNENASNVLLRDPLPSNTTYVLGSTRLNGIAVADVGTASALQTGMLINAPENTTAGAMRADASATVTNVATITFEVQINSNVLNGTIISNQGFVTGFGLGSGLFPEKPSDDPSTTAIPDDPTLNVVGNFPLLVAQKVVAIQADYNGNGILDPGDVLRYTITISNLAAIPATGVVFTDSVPLNTTYVPEINALGVPIVGGTTLNGVIIPDGGVSPLIAGIGVESPASPPGTIVAHGSAVITFDVQVNVGVATGTVISNQGNVTSVELPNELTDADGNASNGHQPTTIIVGTNQQVLITKQVTVVGGGPALAGGQLEYLVTVRNAGTVAATSVVITDNLSLVPFNTQVTYVAGSATLNGVPVAGSVLSAPYGTLLPGATLQLRFRVTINAALPMGTTITNTGQVDWNTPTLTATASVSIDVGGVPGSANLNGHVWHDANFDKLAGATELNLAGWSVDVYRNNILLGTALTDVNGLFTVTGLTPTTSIADQYALRFSAPGAVATTAKLGRTDSVYTNGLQQIGAITALSGSNIQNLNLPITPNGVLYNSILRTPVTGAMLTMMRAGSTVALPQTCFDDPVQQGQVTLANGYYKFDLNFSDPSCPTGADYYIHTTSPLAFMPGQSLIIPPLTDVTTATFSVPTCPTTVSDAIPATSAYCEAQPSEFAPGVAIAANTHGTNYYLKLALSNAFIPGQSQIFNNHIAIDPRLDNAVTITKVSPLQNVTKGQLVPYTITVNNTLAVTLNSMSVVDTFPPGFKYVVGSGRMDGLPVEPVATTRTLTWSNLQLATNTKRVFQLMLIVGSGVKEGKYVNRAQVFNTITGGAGSPEAAATVRVIPDPTLDCSDVIGKVFDDANLNGYQDDGEKGLPGVRVVTARGLIVTTDKYGRFHLTCAVVPDHDRGSNFILKIDDRSLPSGYRITTENPRVQRATRGKMLKFNFGAAIHKIVTLDMADGVFEPGSTDMRMQWKQRIDLLLAELKKAPSVLRLSYLAEAEEEGLVNARIKLVKSEITKLWKKKKENYDLTIETEVFWRTGSPPEKIEISQ